MRDEGLRVASFKVLKEFGGGRRNCSDHCPLWVSLTKEGGSSGQAVTQKLKEVATKKIGSGAAKGASDDRPMSDALKADNVEFDPVDEDYETLNLHESDSEPEDACAAQTEEAICDDDNHAADGVQPFEDNPMPVLHQSRWMQTRAKDTD
jgi:hypothetical protein